MKSICFFLEKVNASGGIPRVVTIIANGLLKEKYKVRIVSLTNSNDNNEKYYIDPFIKVDYLFYNEKVNYKKDFFVIAGRIRDYCLQNSFDYLIVAGMDFVPFFEFGRRAIVRTKTKFIAWEHSNYSIGSVFGYRCWGRKIACKNYYKVIVLTDRDKQLYDNGIKCSKGKVKRIYNPIDEKIIEHKYDSLSHKIISCGALIKQKGFDIAIDVAEIVFAKQKEQKDWIWEVYGEGPQREKLERKIKEKGLSDYFILKGYSDNIQEEYSKSSFFVLPSRFEGFCMVNLEAMQMQLPVIAFDFNCGPNEIIQCEKNGFLIECYDINKMADKILMMMDNSEMRRKMSNNCKDSLAIFKLNVILKEWKEVFNE